MIIYLRMHDSFDSKFQRFVVSPCFVDDSPRGRGSSRLIFRKLRERESKTRAERIEWLRSSSDLTEEFCWNSRSRSFGWSACSSGFAYEFVSRRVTCCCRESGHMSHSHCLCCRKLRERERQREREREREKPERGGGEMDREIEKG